MNLQAITPQHSIIERPGGRDGYYFAPYSTAGPGLITYSQPYSPSQPRAPTHLSSLHHSPTTHQQHAANVQHQHQQHHHHQHQQHQQHQQQMAEAQQQHQQHQQQQQLAVAMANSNAQHLCSLPPPELGPAFDDNHRPSLDGFPTQAQFEELLNEYILSLSPKKRDKALIPQKRYDNILAVLRDPKCTTIESAQFRFWAKKMFRLSQDEQNPAIVYHEGKPVAVREQLYDVLTSSHGHAQHGGRDKTSAQVRKYYSWVPKELIARFVRNCPSCTLRRSSPLEYANTVNSVALQRSHTLEGSPSYAHSQASSSMSPQRTPLSSPVMQASHQMAATQAQIQVSLAAAAGSTGLVATTGDNYAYAPFDYHPVDPRMYSANSAVGINELTN